MIRINLAPGRSAAAGPRGGRRPGYGAAALPVAVLVLALIWAGWDVRSLRRSAAEVARETAAADGELRALAPRARRFDALDARRTQLVAQSAAVDGWRDGRRTPAPLLEEIGRSVPRGLQLEELQQDADGLRLAGQAASVAAVSELAANLETLGAVLPPVEIVETRAAAAGAEAVIGFEIRARLAPPRR